MNTMERARPHTAVRQHRCSTERRHPQGAPASAGIGIRGLKPAPPAPRPVLWITLILCLAASVVAAENPYLQRALDSKFGTGEDSILMIDVKTGKLMAGVHPETMLRETHPPGSLIKIFTTIAYATEHGDRFPQYQCPPTLSRDPAGCWDRNGHGTVNLEKAIAYSCNVYFRQLAENTGPDAFAETLHRFGLVRSPREILDLPG
ncbi:MAG TPA: penicillin-binding transpeptidase domain-containing protein, partial [Acidobacteriota bacterium]|nr:penicillin-binding transpeptidase domain-containing protein [Acidobacteriota bacterium]